MKVGNLLDPSLTYPTNFRGREFGIAFLFIISPLPT
nr:MAG TPA: 54S ribosomal protein [Bacteriophage sp.]